jgi:hypothetical protein
MQSATLYRLKFQLTNQFQLQHHVIEASKGSRSQEIHGK